jgi:threonine dehydrogenase-like Zn-dependent dehydrogenase
MRAIVIDHDRRVVTERDVAEPRLRRPDDVLFRLLQIGVCGTDRDLAAFRFGHGPQGDSFLIAGHEALGEVIASASPAFVPGDIVVPSVRRACHPPCSSCGRGRRDLCLTGRYTERGILGEHGYFTEMAVDQAEDLTRIPAKSSEFAVLLEPLSVVEKAVALAMSLHAGQPERALVMGAGSIGLLTAAVLRLRQMEVEIVSVEPEGSDRAMLAQIAGAEYRTSPDRPADIAIEAAGAPEAVSVAANALAPLGVLVVLGAKRSGDPLPFLNLILGNQILAGSVNASPQAFASAAEELSIIPRGLLSAMVQYRSFSEYRATLLDAPAGAPKIVHRVE